MAAAVIVAILGALLVAVTCLLVDQWLRRRPTDWLAELDHRKLVVHTRDGQTLEGLVDRVAPDCLVLIAARFLEQAGPIDLGGRILIDRQRIAFVQDPERTDPP